MIGANLNGQSAVSKIEERGEAVEEGGGGGGLRVARARALVAGAGSECFAWFRVVKASLLRKQINCLLTCGSYIC